jgi:hypothetical protein
MSSFTLVRDANGSIVGVHSWTTGFVQKRDPWHESRNPDPPHRFRDTDMSDYIDTPTTHIANINISTTATLGTSAR